MVKQIKLATSRHFLENAREEWPEFWHADVSWPPSELIKFGWSSVWHHVDFVKQPNLGFLAIFFRMHRRNGLQFDMLMYPDYLFNCLHFGHGLLNFLIWAVFWLSESSQICSSRSFSWVWERIGGIGLTNLVISKEMEKADFSIRKLSSHRVGGIPDCHVVRLF